MEKYKIEIIKKIDDDFEKLEVLIEKFAIDVFMTQKFNLASKSTKEKQHFIKE